MQLPSCEGDEVKHSRYHEQPISRPRDSQRQGQSSDSIFRNNRRTGSPLCSSLSPRFSPGNNHTWICRSVSKSKCRSKSVMAMVATYSCGLCRTHARNVDGPMNIYHILRRRTYLSCGSANACDDLDHARLRSQVCVCLTIRRIYLSIYPPGGARLPVGSRSIPG